MRAGFDRLLLDPPRSGADVVLKQLPLKGLKRIVYVSCHPASLARDAGYLVNERGWKLRAAGVMELFPHTAHVQSIAMFQPSSEVTPQPRGGPQPVGGRTTTDTVPIRTSKSTRTQTVKETKM